MVDCGEELIRSRLQTARNTGRLVDVSRLGREVGLDCRCEIALRLCDSLVWKYPSAGPQDVIDVKDVLQVYRRRVESTKETLQGYVYVRPTRSPGWLGPRFILKLLVLNKGDETESVTIMPERDTLCSLLSLLHRPLPASLLVDLLLTTRQVKRISAPFEPPLVNSLTTTVDELVDTSPLSWEIMEYLTLCQLPAVPTGFSRDDYREVVLQSLFRKLELAAAVAAKIGAEIKFPVSDVLQQMANVMGVVPLDAVLPLPHPKVEVH